MSEFDDQNPRATIPDAPIPIRNSMPQDVNYQKYDDVHQFWTKFDATVKPLVEEYVAKGFSLEEIIQWMYQAVNTMTTEHSTKNSR